MRWCHSWSFLAALREVPAGLVVMGQEPNQQLPRGRGRCHAQAGVLPVSSVGTTVPLSASPVCICKAGMVCSPGHLGWCQM